MRSIHRLLTLSLTAAFLLLTPLISSITASAEEPKTYQVKFNADLGEWRTQCLPAWDDSRETGDLDYLLSTLADGDLVVIYTSDAPSLDITFPKALGNLTVAGKGDCLIVRSDKPITDFYAIMGSVTSVNAEVENAYIYDNCACNLNKNVKNAYIAGKTEMTMSVSGLGTVEKCEFTQINGSTTCMYNIAQNALRIVNGENKTDAQKYSTDPASAPAATPAAPAPAAAPAPEAAAPAPAASGNSDVTLSPPTGESQNFLLLSGCALFCLASCLTLRKKRNA